MTFIVGLNCSDGIVLCTDSLEDDGVTKKTVDKIRQTGTSEWGVAIAGSGPGMTIDKFCDEVNQSLPRSQFNLKMIENTIEKTLARFHKKYVKQPSDWFSVIVGVHGNDGLERRIYKSSGIVLSRAIRGAHIGVGDELWALVEDSLYHRRNRVVDNLRIAVFATRLACKYSSGVDDPIQVVSYTFGEQFWKVYSATELSAIEMQITPNGLKEAIQRYWRLHNPPTLTEQLRKFGTRVTPRDDLILLEGAKLEELYTVSGRKRASKIFRRNADMLRQRASEEQARFLAAAQCASQSSGDSNRT